MGNQYYPVEQFVTDVEKIARAVQASGRPFKKIWGPPRGALPLAVCLSHRLKLELLMRPPHECDDLCDAPCNYPPSGGTDKNEFLIVDAVADTGNTLAGYHQAGFYIATLFKHPRSRFEPNVWLHEKGDAWVVFWWESLGPLTVLSMPPRSPDPPACCQGS